MTTIKLRRVHLTKRLILSAQLKERGRILISSDAKYCQTGLIVVVEVEVLRVLHFANTRYLDPVSYALRKCDRARGV